ncbi:Hypothetical protein PBC10988_8160 [Planctomycetales bacterium 10988]|nr:Hypothetical protein PBC10988_8160 [Planctomycetales bacterium 10988]
MNWFRKLLFPEKVSWEKKLVFPRWPHLQLTDEANQKIVSALSYQAEVLEDHGSRVKLRHQERSEKFPEPQEGFARKNELIPIEDADNYFIRRLRNAPHQPWCWICHSMASVHRKDYQRAILDLSQALDLFDEPSVRDYRAEQYMQLKEYNRALEDCEAAIAFSPEEPFYYHSRGFCWMKLKQFDKAFQDCEQAIQIDSSFYPAYLLRGDLYMNLKEYEKAVEDYSYAITLESKIVSGYYSRASALIFLDRLEEALQDCHLAIELDPNESASYFYCGRIFSLQHNQAEAIEAYSKAVRLDPKDQCGRLNRGIIYLEQSKFHLALKDFHRVLEIDASDALAYLNLGSLWALQGEYQKALEYYDTCIELESLHQAYSSRAVVYAEMGNYRQALDDFEASLLQENSENAVSRDFAYFLSVCPDENFRDGERALKLAKEGMEKIGMQVDWSFEGTLAAAYAEVGDFDKATEHQKRCLMDTSLDGENREEQEESLQLFLRKTPLRKVGKLMQNLYRTVC